MDDSTTNHSTTTPVSGGVNMTSDQTSIGGDVTGRDKITQVQGDQINYNVQLDVQKLLETLKQALPDGDPLPANVLTVLQDFRTFHTQLYEWKELHNVLNDVIFVFDQFAREIERRDAAGAIGDVRLLKRLWQPVDQKVDLLIEFAKGVSHIGSPLIILPDGSLQGPPWAVELSVAAERLKEVFDGRPVDLATTYDATYAFADAVAKHMYLADKQLRAAAGELYNLSNIVLGRLRHEEV